MIDFKQFLQSKIQYLVSHFRRNCILLDYNGNPLRQINLSFQALSDQYLTLCQQEQKKLQSGNSIQKIGSKSYQMATDKSLKFNQTDLNIKINDKHLKQFMSTIIPTYELAFNIENQDISDQTILKLAELYQSEQCQFTKLKFKGNERITEVGVMKLGQSLRNKSFIKKINFNDLQIGSNGIKYLISHYNSRIIQLISVTNISYLDLGMIGNQSLKYLARNLENPHHLDILCFGQSSIDKWRDDGKQAFQRVIRKCEFNKRMVSINVYPADPMSHYAFISELNIITKKNRSLRIDQRQNQYKSASLNPKHHSYYDPENHNINAYKFSVKSYLTNVFGSLLDQALYFLQKERRNQLRDQAMFQITNQPTNNVILEDICKSDGSIIVLTKYLLGKIKEKQQEEHSSM